MNTASAAEAMLTIDIAATMNPANACDRTRLRRLDIALLEMSTANRSDIAHTDRLWTIFVRARCNHTRFGDGKPGRY